MATTLPSLVSDVPSTLQDLASALNGESHKLALGGDERISQLSLSVTKSLFDLGTFTPHALIQSLMSLSCSIVIGE
jgi:hypothetical protein